MSDNSGRQIAVVVPGMPHPAAPARLIPAHATNSSWAPGLDTRGLTQNFEHTAAAVNERLSSISTPIKFSPEAEAALQKGVVAAEGLTKIASKRVSDVATWVAVLFRQLDEVPRVTPATAIALPEVAPDEMQPIAEPSKSEHKLVLTSERRLRTIVGR